MARDRDEAIRISAMERSVYLGQPYAVVGLPSEGNHKDWNAEAMSLSKLIVFAE